MSDPAEIKDLIERLQRVALIGVDLDRPSDPDGEWWLDLKIDGKPITLSWRRDLGFGIFAAESQDPAFGERPQEIHLEAAAAAGRLLELAGLSVSPKSDAAADGNRGPRVPE